MNAPVCKHQFHRNLLGRCSTCSSLGSQQNSMASSSSQQSSIKHIHELPYPVRTALCELLDSDNSWKRLGGEFLHFSDTKLKLFSFAILRNSSPTNAMFEALDRESFTISRLFRYLLAMSHKRAMQILLPYVDDKLKALYDAEDENNSMQFVDKNSSKLAHATNGYNDGHYHGPPNPHIIRIRPASPDVGNSSDYGAAGGGCNNSWNNLNFKKRTHVNRNGEYSDQSNDSRVTSENDREIASLERDLEVPYCELLAATDNFSESRRIGKGGFGVVYRGTWKGTEVAIKKLKGCDNIGQARNELRALNRYRIDNILPIYGISTDGPEACLLYQFMPNGSLEDRLLCKKGTPPLTWEQRANIGEGLAKALNLLHSLRGEPLVHGDVKSANVLLDSQFQCKLGDFGLAKQMIVSQRFGAATHLTVESVHGTCVYLPSEYLRSKRLSPKVDVYSYGIVMLEMATGKQAYDGKKHLLDLLKEELNAGQTDESRRGAIRLMDPKLQLKPEGSSWFKDLITLGIDCVNKDKRKRPDMAEVLKFFERCKTRDRIRRLSAEFREEPTAVVQSQQTPYLSVPYSNNFHCRIEGSTTSEIPPSAPSTVPQPSEAVQKTHLSSDPQETQSSILSDGTQSNDSTKNNDSVPTQEGAVEATIPLITELGIVSKSTDSEN